MLTTPDARTPGLIHQSISRNFLWNIRLIIHKKRNFKTLYVVTKIQWGKTSKSHNDRKHNTGFLGKKPLQMVSIKLSCPINYRIHVILEHLSFDLFFFFLLVLVWCVLVNKYKPSLLLIILEFWKYQLS